MGRFNLSNWGIRHPQLVAFLILMIAVAGALAATPVVVAAYDSDSAWIASGLAEGAEIVALGVHKLDAEQKVRIVENLAGL